jgi:hypothetical protein
MSFEVAKLRTTSINNGYNDEMKAPFSRTDSND